jgi:type I restriction enzyme R subunit
MTNFIFLKEHDQIFYQLAFQAEQAFSSDPNTTLMKLRQLGEALAQDLASRVGIAFDERTSQSDLLYSLSRRISLEPAVRELFHTLRIEGNKAAHQFNTNHSQALDALKVARTLCVWYHQAFGSTGPDFSPGKFVLPKDPSSGLRQLQQQIEELKAQLLDSHQQLEQSAELAELKQHEAEEYAVLAGQMDAERQVYEQVALEQASAMDALKKDFESRLKQTQLPENTQQLTDQLQAVKQSTRKASSKLHLSEELTRLLIDTQLIEAGWEADTETLDYRKGSRPEAGRMMAIAEWPCFNPLTKKNTRADYVLFYGLKPLATVEAKKFGNDVADDLRQAEEYCRDFGAKGIKSEAVIEAFATYRSAWPVAADSNETYKLPFAFSTNGREYQNQLKTKSGIWFRDLRKPTNKSRPLMGWFGPQALLDQFRHDEAVAASKVRSNPWGKLSLRDYQKSAVLAIEESLLRGDRQALLAMATGTGKTRTIIALMYRLLAANYFKRILFLVDRSTLGTQAQNAFSEIRPEGSLSFEQIYDVKELGDKLPDTKTRVQVATVQSMVKRIFAADNPPPIDQFDCIIVDEAHRGYTLDKDMTEGEMELRDLNEYVSAYRRVLDYFDAVRVGLTATPAAHTVDIFGHPVYTYSYREAVIDGWLIDYAPPYTFTTRLSQEGIHFDSGAEVSVVNQIGEKRLEVLPDELDFAVEDFNRKVMSDKFNEVICDELAANYLDPTSGEKTLIFCVSDIHADLVVEKMKAMLDKYHGPQPDKAVMKITGAIRDPQGAIRQFKNEQYPNIAVTVDLLTTGVDVPAICNIVFLRRVRSRILYEQMKGRATRLCPNINKDLFHIFDAVGLYKVLAPVDTMRPVVQQVSVSIEKIITELNNPDSYIYAGEAVTDPAQQEQGDRTHAEEIHQQLIAKIQRLVRRSEHVEDFPDAQKPLELLDVLLKSQFAADSTFQKLPATLKELGSKATGQLFVNQPSLIKLLEDLRSGLRFDAGDLVISDHEDELLETNRGYGVDAEGKPIQKPQDYLDAFQSFIRNNINKVAALQAVTTRPSDLTRQDLRELRLLLSQHEFDENKLHDAWKEARNEDIAASIIGYIRQAALGDPLIPFEQRVDSALTRIKGQQRWTKNQERWLDRIATQLKKSVIIDDAALESSPFKEQGGRAGVERQLGGKLDDVLELFNTYLWEVSA